ncbi:hypothetical protein G8O24_21035 [Bradyrhizobium sp. INPA01-394B]|uniref:Uncharacterized protein n=1 Tax=Bradyrhizobium campsiandrae TaxID=1729892 RepID=A0ABR7U5Z5_9BRAD|nr:hypothetical protein [Bradyrhizobium campsiandrae]MBC9879828.1 hypothetical protein [Bradyrhizobium campsiandrae]MBC9978839.1 hypothetical protein [Bradyrhizobium campsiandrae]
MNVAVPLPPSVDVIDVDVVPKLFVGTVFPLQQLFALTPPDGPPTTMASGKIVSANALVEETADTLNIIPKATENLTPRVLILPIKPPVK